MIEDFELLLQTLQEEGFSWCKQREENCAGARSDPGDTRMGARARGGAAREADAASTALLFAGPRFSVRFERVQTSLLGGWGIVLDPLLNTPAVSVSRL
ncbi:hypothetical protein J6590_053235 [Homalodisca vitripennis]|nr:hypothetical protein J6590_053235 [Homalodisca vitripennis]